MKRLRQLPGWRLVILKTMLKKMQMNQSVRMGYLSQNYASSKGSAEPAHQPRPIAKAKARIFSLVDLQNFFFRSRSGTKKIKKGVKKTS